MYSWPSGDTWYWCCAWGCGCVEVCGDDSRVDAAIAMAKEARGFGEFEF